MKPTSLTPEVDFILTSPLSSRKRRSWSKAPDRYNKGNSRRTILKLHNLEQKLFTNSQIMFMFTESSGKQEKRKSITEALEEIFNPLDNDDDTAYNSMSPDASMDCKTLVAPNTKHDDEPLTSAGSYFHI